MNSVGSWVIVKEPAQGIIVINQNQEIQVLYSGFTNQSELGVSEIPLGEIKRIGWQDGIPANEHASSNPPFKPGLMDDLIPRS